MSKLVEIGVIYMISYPNGKIYIGQDRTDDPNYFGSANSELIRKDFTFAEQRDFTVRKQILWRKRGTTIKQMNQQERKLINEHRSNDPAIGYNRTR